MSFIFSLCVSESYPYPGYPVPDNTQLETAFTKANSFLFVRHPFERFVSAYKMFKDFVDAKVVKSAYTRRNKYYVNNVTV